jgi:hypothetical protein
MNNKGIAIRTILLLLIGVLVAGILIYFVYRSFSGSAMSREECRARGISWCTSCWNAMNAAGCSDWDCDVGPDPPPDLENCADDYYGEDLTDDDDCNGLKDFCSAFIPT